MSKMFGAIIFSLSLSLFHAVSSFADHTAQVFNNERALIITDKAKEPECVDVYPSYPLSPMYQDVIITAVDTHFDNSTTVEFSCPQVKIFSIQTISATEIRVGIGTFSSDSPEYMCDIEIITGDETVVCSGAFELRSPPQCEEVQFEPEEFMYCTGQPATLDIHLTSDTKLFDTATEVEFLCPYEVDLQLNDVTFLSDEELIANITVLNTIRGGRCDITIRSGEHTIVCGCGFRVTYPGPGRPLESIFPESIDTEVGIVPRFLFFRVFGNELCDNINFTHESKIQILPDTGGIYVLCSYAVSPKEIIMLAMIWGAEKGSYDVYVDGHKGVEIEIY